MSVDFAAAARDYGVYLSTLTPESVERLRDLATPDLRFQDPFNDLQGVDAVIRLFERMFEEASAVRFEIREQIGEGPNVVLRWDFTCRPKHRFVGELPIEGVSLIRFDGQGRVVEHVDYWDAGRQIYGRLPILGTVVRAIARRLGTMGEMP